MLETLKLRLEELKKSLDLSASSHHSIIGRMQEVQEWIFALEKKAAEAEEKSVEVVS